MADHPPQPRTDLEAENDQYIGGEDQPTQTYDERLAASLYADNSSQNQVLIQVFLALAGAGVGYGIEVRDAYAFFAKNKIDAEKLLTDSKYRAQVKKYAGHLNFWEKRGTGKLDAVLKGANNAIKEVDTTNKKLVELKEGLIKDYSTELQNLYGLSKSEIDAITQKAKYALQKDPGLSMQDFMQQEGQVIARKRIGEEVNKEKLNPEQKKEKVKTRLSEIDERFSQRTAVAGGFEENSHFELIYDCKQKLDQVIAQPPAVPQSVAVQSTTPSTYPSLTSAPKRLSFPKISFPSIPSISFPKMSFGGLGGGLKSTFESGGLLSKGISGGLNLAKSVLPKAASFALPPLGAALTVLSAIDAVTGGMLSKTAGLVIGGIIIVAIGLPIVMMLFLSKNTFSSFTSGNSTVLRASVKNDRSISWTEFEKNFLTLGKTKEKELSWGEFEKSIFVKELSLNPDRHDDVKK